MKFFWLVCVVLLFSVIGLSQRTEPGSESELAEISARGRMLFDYDFAAWNSTDAVLALKPAPGGFDKYIAQKTATGWTVAYGKLNADQSKFLIAFEAAQDKSPATFKVAKPEPPKEEGGFYLFAARAIDLARKDFGGANRPYNVAVLPTKANQLYVYLVPAQTKVGIFPLGGDVRYLISADGSKIVEKRQLHKSIIEFTAPEGSTPQAGYHTAILDDVPEDTDVFHVLARKPSVIEWVVTSKFVYQIKGDGSIMYVMKREAFLKIGKPGN
jgi:hypothetical protein